MTNSLAGYTALVTGGNSGIGRATALALASRGAHVVLSGRDAGRGEKAVAEKRGHGVIVNVSTMVAEFGMPQMALYGSSKAALVLLTKSWAAEYGPAGVRVNAVSPGPTRTEGTAGMGEALDQLAAAAPSGRPGLPEEIASAIVYLASDEASFVQGALLPVDGGRVAV